MTWIVMLALVLLFSFTYILNNNRYKKGKKAFDKKKKESDLSCFKNNIEVTNLKRTNEILTKELNISKIFLENTSDPIVVLDKNRKILLASHSFEMMTGFPWQELVNQELVMLESESYSGKKYKEILDISVLNDNYSEEIWNRKKTGELYQTLVLSRSIKNNENRIEYFVVSFCKNSIGNNILDSKIDPLTKLPNRSLFFDRLEQSLKSAKRNRSIGALIFLDLDHFKAINDTVGHNIGDLLLKEVSLRLQKLVRDSDTVSRLSGDEFTIILPNISKAKDAGLVAENVVNKITDDYYLKGHTLNITCSVGISIFFTDGSTPNTLLESADKAMYAAKKEGRNNFRFFSEKIEESANSQKATLSEIKKLLKNKELSFFYKPIITESKKINEVDLCLQPNNSIKSEISGVDILEVTKENEITLEITDWCLKKMKTENILSLKHFKIGIPISAIYFKQSNIVSKLKEIYTQEESLNIKLKIEETTIASNLIESIPKLKELLSYGFNISLTNFGKGKLSLLDYKKLSFNSITISDLNDLEQDYDFILDNAVLLTDDIIVDFDLPIKNKKRAIKKVFNSPVTYTELITKTVIIENKEH